LCLVTLFGYDCAKKVRFCPLGWSHSYPFEINSLVLLVREPFLAQSLQLSTHLKLCDIPVQILTRGGSGCELTVEVH
jgi:hypothetical protein